MIAVAVSIILALSGYVFTYFHRRALDVRAARLQRHNLQLRDLYGPLYARLMTSKLLWDAFVQHYWPEHAGPALFGPGFEPTPEEQAQWRLWMTEVLAPNNAAIEHLVLENVDLLREPEFPSEFFDLLAHIGSYKAVMRKWLDGDYSEQTAVCNFPRSLLAKIEDDYRRLHAEQQALLRKSGD